MPTIAMMTDFGLKDGNVGVMKGVIWGICPDVQIADLSHLIQPQNVREASLILARSASYFAADAIFLIVVDPGVGTDRRPMGARIGAQYFVGPDNGLITLWLDQARSRGATTAFVALDQPEYWLPQVSRVFHGRDIFAPVAAHLAKGVPLGDLGTPITDPVELELPRPRKLGAGWLGEIIHIDHFGNAASNIGEQHVAKLLAGKKPVVVEVGGQIIQGMVNTFGEREPGEVVALLGSTGSLIISVVNGDAAASLGIKVGDPIRVEIPNPSSGQAGDPGR